MVNDKKTKTGKAGKGSDKARGRKHRDYRKTSKEIAKLPGISESPFTPVDRIGLNVVRDAHGKGLATTSVNLSRGADENAPQTNIISLTPSLPGAVSSVMTPDKFHALPKLAQAVMDASGGEALATLMVPVGAHKYWRALDSNPTAKAHTVNLHGRKPKIFKSMMAKSGNDQGKNQGHRVWEVEDDNNGPQDLRCPQCFQNHSLEHCVVAFPDGTVHGCPICNTREHNIDDCAEWKALPDMEKAEWLFERRGNMPPLQTKEYWLATAHFYYSQYPDARRFTAFPWTLEFSKKTTDQNTLGRYYVNKKNRAFLPRDPATETWQKFWETACAFVRTQPGPSAGKSDVQEQGLRRYNPDIFAADDNNDEGPPPSEDESMDTGDQEPFPGSPWPPSSRRLPIRRQPAGNDALSNQRDDGEDLLLGSGSLGSRSSDLDSANAASASARLVAAMQRPEDVDEEDMSQSSNGPLSPTETTMEPVSGRQDEQHQQNLRRRQLAPLYTWSLF